MTPGKTILLLLVLMLVAALGVTILPTLHRQDRMTYEWERSWGSPGSGPGEFQGPIGVVVDDSGFVYVSDSGNDRIQKFTARGKFVGGWGGTGTEPGQLRRPMHMALVEDTLLHVAEYLNDRIQIFGPSGALLGTVDEDTATTDGALDAPAGVGRTPGGDEFWIPDFFNHRIAVIGRSGEYRGRIGASGRWLPGRLHYPTDVAFGPDGTAYVADAYNNRIQRYSSEGEYLGSWGGPLGLGIPGPWKGWFKVATGVHVDGAGRVFVADFYNDRVQAFDSEGQYLGEWGETGSGNGQMDRPTDIATGPDGRVYVVDFGNDRIQVFTCAACDGR